MKLNPKNIFFNISVFAFGITLSWLTFSFAVESNQANKIDNYEYKGIIYKSNKIYKYENSQEARLTLAIKQVLAQNPETSILNLNVTAVGSRITISGKAENKDQIQKAVNLTLAIPGVKEVISTVVIDPTIQISNSNQLL